jgi:ribosomal protein S8
MKTLKHAQKTNIQTQKVFNHMQKYGSINRYEADEIGVCSLAARVQNLEELGLVYNHIDENDIMDFHGISHNGIRRYVIDWQRMTPKAVDYFLRCGK